MRPLILLLPPHYWLRSSYRSGAGDRAESIDTGDSYQHPDQHSDTDPDLDTHLHPDAHCHSYQHPDQHTDTDPDRHSHQHPDQYIDVDSHPHADLHVHSNWHYHTTSNQHTDPPAPAGRCDPHPFGYRSRLDGTSAGVAGCVAVTSCGLGRNG